MEGTKGLRRVRRVLRALTLGAVGVGVTLSILHQSGLGALFLYEGDFVVRIDVGRSEEDTRLYLETGLAF